MNSLYTTPLPKDNVFAMLNWACSALKKLGHDKDEITLLKNKVYASKDFDEACKAMEKYFPIED